MGMARSPHLTVEEQAHEEAVMVVQLRLLADWLARVRVRRQEASIAADLARCQLAEARAHEVSLRPLPRLGSQRRTVGPTAFVDEPRRVCKACHVEQPIAHFWKDLAARNGHKPVCRDCLLALRHHGLRVGRRPVSLRRSA